MNAYAFAVKFVSGVEFTDEVVSIAQVVLESLILAHSKAKVFTHRHSSAMFKSSYAAKKLWHDR